MPSHIPEVTVEKCFSIYSIYLIMAHIIILWLSNQIKIQTNMLTFVLFCLSLFVNKIMCTFVTVSINKYE